MARTNSNSFRITVIAPSTPAWLLGASVLEWKRLTGSAMSNLTISVNPGGKIAAGILDPWNGYAFDPVNNIAYAPGTGGHDDWWGNQVLGFDIRVDSPVWVELLASTSGWASPNDSTRYSDGSVPSAHTYFGAKFISARGRAMRFPGGAYATTGNPKLTTEGYSVASNAWDPAGTYPSLPLLADQAYPEYAICKHATTEDVYVFYLNYNVFRWNQALNTYTALNPTSVPDTIGASTAHDTSRGKIYLYGGFGSLEKFYDIAGNSFGAWAITGSVPTAVAASAFSIAGYGMGYDPQLDRVVLRLGDAGGEVHAIHPDTGVSTLLATTGGGSISAVAPTAGTPGVNIFDKWNYVSNLAGYAGWLYTPRHSSDSWFLVTKVP